MDPREILVDAAKARGASLAALSRMLGRNGTYLQQFVTKGSPRKLEEDDRAKLAQFLGVSEDALGGPQEKSYKSPAGAWVDVPRLAVDVSAGPGAVGGQEQAFDAFRFSRKWLAEQGLEGSKLSAIRVIGDSMEPLLREGDEVLVRPAPATFPRRDPCGAARRYAAGEAGGSAGRGAVFAAQPKSRLSADCSGGGGFRGDWAGGLEKRRL